MGRPKQYGIPLGIKDLFCTKGVASQAGSRILEGFKPEYESTVTSQLFDAGAVMLGKHTIKHWSSTQPSVALSSGPVLRIVGWPW